MANNLDKLVELMKEKLMVSNEKKNTNFNPDTRILDLTKNSTRIQSFLGQSSKG